MKPKWYYHNGQKRCVRFKTGNCIVPCPIGFQRHGDCNYHPVKPKPKMVNVKAWAIIKNDYTFSGKPVLQGARTFKRDNNEIPCTITIDKKYLKAKK